MAAVGDHRTGPRHVHPDVLSALGSAWGSGRGGNRVTAARTCAKAGRGASPGTGPGAPAPRHPLARVPAGGRPTPRASASSWDGGTSRGFALKPRVHRATVCSCRTREGSNGVESGGGTPSPRRLVGLALPLHLYSQLSGPTGVASFSLPPPASTEPVWLVPDKPSEAGPEWRPPSRQRETVKRVPHRPALTALLHWVPQALGQHCAVAAVAGNEPPRGARLLRGPELACRLLSENADDSMRDAAQLRLPGAHGPLLRAELTAPVHVASQSPPRRHQTSASEIVFSPQLPILFFLKIFFFDVDHLQSLC